VSKPNSQSLCKEPVPPVYAQTLRDFRQPDKLAPHHRHLRLVAGYEILEELGSGGVGVVYKARQLQLDRLVALKMLRSLNASRDDLVRFRTEAEAVAQLSHPNIVQIHEIGEHEDQPFLSLEYVSGGSLDFWLASGPIACDRAARLVRTLALAVDFAHRHGIIHRDLKPANVLLVADQLEPFSTPKITDFGLAKRLDLDVNHTRAGEILGTPCYMSPEQAEGRLDVGPAVDIYALGAILYECLTGRPPFLGDSLFETLQLVRTHDPVAPRSLNPGVPSDLEIICLKCLSKDPHKRYASANDLAEDLHRHLLGEPIRARPVGMLERLYKRVRRSPMAVALTLVSTALVGVILTAVPLHVLSLRRQVDRISKEIQKTQDENRRTELRATAERKLADGRLALASNEMDQIERAIVLFATVEETLREEEAGLHLLYEEARQLRLQARGKREQLTLAIRVKEAISKASVLYDDAFFQLHYDLVSGPGTDRPATCHALSEKALKLLPEIDNLTGEDATRLNELRRDLLLLEAEAIFRREAKDGGGPKVALGVLDRVIQNEGGWHGLRLRRARYLNALGDKAAASKERDLAKQAGPINVADWIVTGQEHWFAGNIKAALTAFDRALNEQPDLFWPRFLRAVGLQKIQEFGEARVDTSYCIRIRPQFAWGYILRAVLHMRAGQFKPAREDLERAGRLKLDKASGYALQVHRGLLALNEKNLAEATKEFEQAASFAPELPHAHANLAQLHWQQGDLVAALKRLDHALTLKPVPAELYRTRSQILQQQGKLAEALSDLNRLIAENQDPKDRLERARLLYRLEKFDQVISDCHSLEQPEAVRLLAESLLETGQPKRALEAFERYGKLAKPDVDLYRRKARARATSGDLPGVIDEFTLALNICPKDATEQRASLLVSRGWANLVNSAAKNARNDFETSLKLRPGDVEALIGLGTAKIDAGNSADVKSALVDLENARTIGPETPRLWYQAARAYCRAAGQLPLQKKDLERKATFCLGEALKATKAPRRASFWREQVRKDDAFRSLSATAEFIALERSVSGK
jgi:serine/threonine protein kinase/tetratricopeptide (TPR) repeat protein